MQYHFLYVFWCEDSISEVFSLFGGHLHGQNLFAMLFMAIYSQTLYLRHRYLTFSVCGS